MNSEKAKTLAPLLMGLGRRVRQHIEEQIAKGLLQPERIRVFRYSFTRFEYGENGLGNYREEIQEIEKEEWGRAWLRGVESTTESDEWRALADEFDNTQPLWSFVVCLASKRLNRGELTDTDLEAIRDDFLAESQGQPIHYQLDVHISGLSVMTDPLSMRLGDGSVRLRPTRPEDIAVDRPVSMGQGFLENFDAVAVYDTTAISVGQAQKKIEWLLALFRLATSGSVQNSSYTIDSNSCRFPGMPVRLVCGMMGGKHRVGRVNGANQDRFIATCERVGKELPSDIAEEERSKVDPLAVALHRFSDALFTRGVVERRIASAVMGVESLYMSDKDVIGYKLAMRLAKSLGYLGFEPMKVKKTVGDAYTIRSKYVHGDSLSGSEMKKMSDRYSGLDSLLSDCLTYLRSALIFALLGVKGKEQRIALIDESLIDDSKAAELRRALDAIRDIAGP